MCVQGHDPLTVFFFSFFFFRSFFFSVVLSPRYNRTGWLGVKHQCTYFCRPIFLIGRKCMTLIIRSVKTCALGPPRPCLMVSVDVNQYWTMLRHWSQLVSRHPRTLSNTTAATAASSFPKCPCRSRSSFSWSCCLDTSASGSEESLHCVLDGLNKSYVIAFSDFWLFIHASNLLSSPPIPRSPTKQKTG